MIDTGKIRPLRNAPSPPASGRDAAPIVVERDGRADLGDGVLAVLGGERDELVDDRGEVVAPARADEERRDRTRDRQRPVLEQLVDDARAPVERQTRVREQLAVLLEMVKERQENELVNNASYGLLKNASPAMRVSTRAGAPTPDDLDELITKVWKEPAFFLAHPRAIAAFGRECTHRGVPPATVTPRFHGTFGLAKGVTAIVSPAPPW